MPLPEVLEHLSHYYADRSVAAPYAHSVRGHASYLSFDDVTHKPSPLYAFAIETCAIIHAFRKEIDGRCDIKIAIFESTSDRCFATRVSDEIFLIAISFGNFIYNACTSSHILGVKQVRDFLQIPDRKYKIDCNINPDELLSLDYEENIEDRYRALPIAMSLAIFTILHELAHIINGHIDYKIKHYRNMPYQDKIITNKCLEMDADLFAINRLQDHLLQLEAFETDMDFHNRIFMKNFMAIVISLMFLDFDSTEIIEPENVKAGETHPPNFSRFNYSMACLCAPGDEATILNSQSMYGVMQRLLRAQLEKKNLTETPGYVDKLIDTMNENQIHHRDLEKRWGEIRPELMHLRRRTSEIAQETIFRNPPKLIERR